MMTGGSERLGGVRYEPDERPPTMLACGLGMQLAVLCIAGIALTPAIVVRAAGGSESYLAWAVFAAVLVSGVSTLLQAVRIGRIGAGCVLAMGTSGAFIAICVSAIAGGGPAMLATLVVTSSLFQFLIAWRLSLLRRILTPTVAGTVIMLIPVTVMPIVFDMLTHAPEGTPSLALSLSALVTVLVICGISLKATGALRLWAPVIGIVAGCAVAGFYGLYDVGSVVSAAWVGLPEGGWPGFDLDFGPVFWGLLPAFVFVTLVGAIETVGDGIAIQRVSWRRPRAVDFRAVQGAVTADGVGNLLSGLMGTVPNTTYSSSISVTALTGVGARSVGIALGIAFIVVAFLPKALAVVLAIGDYKETLTLSDPAPIFRVSEGRVEMAKNAPGKAHREGLTVVELMDMFPTEEAATKWFESIIWPDGRHCPKCGSVRTREASHKYMPYWCTDCRSYFSVKTGTAMQASKIPMRKWAIAIYLCLTSLKSVSSMKLKRDIGVSQPSAWFMMQRIREAWGGEGEGPFDGPVEFDESYFGGKRKNKSNAQRAEATGRGPVDMTAVVGAKDRATNKVNARVIKDTDKDTLQDFVAKNAEPHAVVYTDDAAAYEGIPNPHESVKHSVSEYVDGMAHTNGIESFWSMLKRAHKGTFHKISPKHLQRYVSEFAGKHNIRDSGTLAQMHDTVARLIGRNLLYRDLIASNGLSNASRS